MSQSKAYTSLKKVKWVGKNQFIIHKRELLESYSWRNMSINCFRLISLLELNYMSSAGEDNGRLLATYNQIKNFGIRKNSIKKAIEEAYHLGLIKYKLSNTIGKYGKYTYEFTLTYLPESFIEKGVRLFTMPTNEWKKIKIASNENDTIYSNESDTIEKQETTKINNCISNESDTTIYIYTDREENERNVINA